MSSYSYTYSLSNDFISTVIVDFTEFEYKLTDTFPSNPSYITSSGDILKIIFQYQLSNSDITLLNNLVTTYTNSYSQVYPAPTLKINGDHSNDVITFTKSPDTVVSRSTIDTLQNKTLTGLTNTIDANNLRNGNTWVVPLGGNMPLPGRVLTYNGSSASWSSNYIKPYITLSPLTYSVGTVSQTSNTITGVDTTFTYDMVGGIIIFDNDIYTVITSFINSTSLTAAISQNVSSRGYTIHYGGLQSDNLGNTSINNITVQNTLNVPGSIVGPTITDINTEINARSYVTDPRFKCQNTIIVKQVNPGIGEFSSINDAANSIIDASNTNLYLIKVGPGIYTESMITLPPYVSICGASIISTVVQPDGDHHIFNLVGTCEISFMRLQNAPTGFAAVSCSDSGDYTQMHKVSIYDCSIGILVESITRDTICYLEYVDVNGIYSYGIIANSTNGFMAKINTENFYTFPTYNENLVSHISASGNNFEIDIQLGSITGIGIETGISLVGPGRLVISGYQIKGCATGLYIENGSDVALSAIIINSCYSAILIGSAGLPPDVDANGIILTDNLKDLQINNIDTSGSFTGTINYVKTFINSLTSYPINKKNNNTIYVESSGGDFTSINSAIAHVNIDVIATLTEGSQTITSNGLFTPVMTFLLVTGSGIPASTSATYIDDYTIELSNPVTESGDFTIYFIRSSINSPFIISVGIGTFIETSINLPKYVTIKGTNITASVISAADPSQEYLIKMTDGCTLSSLTLDGTAYSYANNITSPIISVNGGLNFIVIDNIVVGNGSLGVYIDSSLNAVDNMQFNTVVGSNIQKFIHIDGNISNDNKINVSIMNSLYQNTLNNAQVCINIQGSNSSLKCLYSDFLGTNITDSVGIIIGDGAICTLSACVFAYWYMSCYVPPTGLGPNLEINSVFFDDSIIDIQIDNITTTGFYFGPYVLSKLYIPYNCPFSIANLGLRTVRIAKKGADFTNIPDALNWINPNILSQLIDESTIITSNGLYSHTLDNLLVKGVGIPNNTIATYIDKNTMELSNPATLTQSSVINFIRATLDLPFTINIGPGEYRSKSFTIPEYVSIIGSNRQTCILAPSDSGNPFIIMSKKTILNSLTITGATLGILVDSVQRSTNMDPINPINIPIPVYEVGALIQLCTISNCDTGIKLTSTTFRSELKLYDCVFMYNFTTCLLVDGTSSSTVDLCELKCNNLYFDVGNDNYTGLLFYGSNVSVNLTNIIIKGNEKDYNGIILYDGCNVTVSSSHIINATTALSVLNSGSAPQIKFYAISFDNSSLYDINVQHPNTNGSISYCLADREKVSINTSSSINLTYDDALTTSTTLVGKLYLGENNSDTCNVNDLIKRVPSMGLLMGGIIQSINGFEISLSNGSGYIESNGILKHIEWDNALLTLPPSTTNYIYIDNFSVLQYNPSKPDTISTILFGRVRTDNTTIEFIDASPVKSFHSTNQIDTYNRDVFGSIFASGSIVTVNINLEIAISSGKYYLSGIVFNPSGHTSPTPFTVYYHTNGIFTKITNVTILDHLQYDNGTDLVQLTPNYYAKHSLYLIGEGANEKYFVVYSSTEYISISDAQNSSLAFPPVYFSEGVVVIASIIVSQADPTFSLVKSERPVPSFNATAISSSIFHGSLLGLLADDHPQYFRTDGTRTMSGDIDLATNSIINANLINGVNIRSHASRHLPNGNDPLTTGVATTILGTTTINGTGVSNSLARSDHIHYIDQSTLDRNIIGGSQPLAVSRGGSGTTSLTSGNFIQANGTFAYSATKAVPSGNVVGTTDSQIITNKILTDPSNIIIAYPKLGNILSVDALYGNDITASRAGLPYKTIAAALLASTSGDEIRLNSGTYNESSLIIPDGLSIRGTNVNTTIITATVTTSTILITMGANCRIEDVSLRLLSNTPNITLTGVLFPATTTLTSSLKSVTALINNTTNNNSTIFGIRANGNAPTSLTANTILLCAIVVMSQLATSGSIRSLYVDGATPIYSNISQFTAIGGSGVSAVACETTNPSAIISNKLSSSKGTTSDNLQSSGTILFGVVESLNNSMLITYPSNQLTLGSIGTQTIINSQSSASRILTLPDITDVLVSKNSTDILTNKTLISPIFNTIVNSGILTLPFGADNLVARNSIDTLTNKTLISPTLSTIINSGTLTLPSGTDNLIARNSTDILINKTLTGMSNNIDANSLRYGNTWVIPLSGPSPQTGAVLTYNGSSAYWNNGINSTYITTSSNIYFAGTASQTSFTVTGNGTTFSPNMVGGIIIFSTGQQAFISAFNSITSLTVIQPQTISSTTFTIFYGGFQTDGDGNTSVKYLYNAQLIDNNIAITNYSDRTKLIKFNLLSANTNSTLTLNAAQTINRTITFPDISDTLVTLTAPQTLTNKILTNPSISTITNTGILSLPSSTDTLIARNTTDLLSNKTLNNSTVFYVDNTDNTKRIGFNNSASTTGTTLTFATIQTTNRTITFPNISDTVVTLTAAQTLTSKTLTTPIISTIVNTGTLTLPSSTDTLIARNTIDSLTNKTLNNNSVYFVDNIDTTKKIGFNSSTSTAGTTLTLLGNQTANRTITFPDISDTLASLNATQTLTNKILTNPIISTIVNIGTLTLPSSTDTLIARNTTDLLTNKTLNNNSVYFVDNTDTTKKMGFNTSTSSTGTTLILNSSQTANRTINFPDISDTVVTLSASQTLTNKILTTPVISTIINVGTLSLPLSTDTLVARNTTDLLNNKTLNNNTVFFVDNIDNTKKIGFNTTANTTGTSLTISSINTANRTIVFPDVSDTITTLNATQTLTNKDLTSSTNIIIAYPKIGNTIYVDNIYGNNATASRGGLPFLTIASALAIALSGDVINISSGTYNEFNLVVPNGVILKGNSMLNTSIGGSVTTSTTVITLGINSSLIDLNILLTSATGGITLTAVILSATSSASTQIRTCSISITSTTSSSVTIYGVRSNGNGIPSDSEFYALRSSTIVVRAAAAIFGTARCIYVDGASSLYCRDINCSAIGGSGINAIALETNNPSTILRLHIGSAKGTTGDYLQTSGNIILSGVDLTTSTAFNSSNNQIILGNVSTTTLSATSSSNRIVTFPDASDILVGKNTIDLLTNKTLNNSNVFLVDNTDNTKRFSFNNNNSTTGTTLTFNGIQTTNRTITFPDISDILVSLTAQQTLTNKILTAPVISTIVNTGTLTLPTSTDNLIGRNTTDLLTNKTLNANTVFFVDNSNNTKRIGFNIAGSSPSTSLTLAGIQTVNRTITFPDISDILVTLTASQTLTNKVLTSPVISTIVNIGTLTLPSSTDTLIARNTTDLLTNKMLSNNNVYFVDNIDNTKRVVYNNNASTTGTTLTLSGIQTANRTITFPDVSDILVTLTASQTLSNKTIISTTLNNNTVFHVDNIDNTKRFAYNNSTSTTGTTLTLNGIQTANRTIIFPDISDTLVTLTASQTLINKILTSPTISTILNTGTLTLPSSTDTLIARNTIDLLTNKTLNNSSVYYVDNVDNTKRIGFNTSTSTTGTTLTLNSIQSANRTITFPDISDTVVTLNALQTLTNKTINNPTISTITNIGTLSLPTSTDVLVGRNTVDIMTNKNLTSNTNTILSYVKLGGIIIVDSFNGNNATASRTGLPFLTIGTAIAAALSGDTIWILPGTYVESGLVLPTNVALRGSNVQTCIISANVSTSTTLITIGNMCRIEDLTIRITSSTSGITLQCIVFSGTTVIDSKIRTCNISATNTTTGIATIYTIRSNGTGIPSSTDTQAIRGTTIIASAVNAVSGVIRAVYVDTANYFYIRDCNVTAIGNAGVSAIGAETANAGGGLYMRSGSSRGSTSDYLQTAGTIMYTSVDLTSGTTFTSTTNQLILGNPFTTTLNAISTANIILTMPNLTDTLISRNSTDLITNKSIINGSNFFIDGTDNTKKIGFVNSGASTSTLLSISAAQTTSQILYIPNITASDTLVTQSFPQTITNKTFISPVISTIVNSGILTLPSTTDVLIGRNTVDTITNKNLTSPTNTILGFVKLGAVLIVDKINGNNTTASRGGLPFLTISAALSLALSGDIIWVLPGTYAESGLTIPSGVAVRGINAQSCVISATVSTSTTMITLSNTSVLEDLTIRISSSSAGITLQCILFPASTTIDAKIRTCIISATNTTTGIATMYTVRSNGTGFPPTSDTQALRGSTLICSATSATGGTARTIYIDNANALYARDCNVICTGGAGISAIAVETNNSTSVFYMRSGSSKGTTLDYLQTSGTITLTGVDLTNGTAFTPQNNQLVFGNLFTTTLNASSTSNVIITMPNLTDTLITRNSTDIIANKSLYNINNFFVDNTDNTKRIAFSTSSSTTGTTLTLNAIQTLNRTITFPDISDTVVTLTSLQTLTNKTLSAPIISTIINTGTLTLPSSTDTLIARNTTDVLTNKSLNNTNVFHVDGTDNTKKIGYQTNGATTNTTLTIIGIQSTNRTITFPDISDTVVTLTAAQTLSNKTLVNPNIATIVNNGILSLPSLSDTLIGRNTTDLLTNKSLNNINNFFVDNADNTKKIGFQTSGSTTGTTLTLNGVQSASRIITFPDVSDTVVTLSSSQTLINKTLTAPIISTIVNTGTLTLPSSTDTLVGRNTTDILTNKSLVNANVFHVDGTDNTKKIGFISSSASASTILSISQAQTTSQTVNIPNITASDTFVTQNFTQTLTNKTLIAPIISTIVNTGTLTLPLSTDTLIGRNTTDVLTNKSLVNANVFHVDSIDNTKKIGYQTNGSTTNTTLTLIGIQTANRTITFPDISDTIVTLTAQQILTNKSFSFLTLAGNFSAPQWTTNGVQYRANAATFTDNSTPASTVVATNMISAFGQATINATNTAVTYTNAATLYFAGPPLAGTNVTLTNSFGLYIASGNTFFGGNLNFGATNITYATISTTPTSALISTSTTQLTFQQTGDTFGTTSLSIVNRNGANGAIFTNTSIDLVDFIFTPSSNVSQNIRYEHRAGSYFGTNNVGGEFEFGVPAAPSFITGPATTGVLLGNFGIGTANATAKLHISGNVGAPAWTNNGIALRTDSAIYTDSTSSGTVATNSVVTFNIPTIAANSTTNYTNASNVFIAGPPLPGSNVTFTNAYSLYVNGLSSFSHIGGISGTPTFVIGNGLGANGRVTSIIGTDIAGTINLTSTSAGTTNATIVTVTFNIPFTITPFVIISPSNAVTARLAIASTPFVTETVNTFVITANTTALPAGAYSWTYHAIQ